jgi:hypothetical protein
MSCPQVQATQVVSIPAELSKWFVFLKIYLFKGFEASSGADSRQEHDVAAATARLAASV